MGLPMVLPCWGWPALFTHMSQAHSHGMQGMLGTSICNGVIMAANASRAIAILFPSHAVHGVTAQHACSIGEHCSADLPGTDRALTREDELGSMWQVSRVAQPALLPAAAA